MKLLNWVIALACSAALLPAAALAAEKKEPKLTCCEQAAADGKECPHKCCVAAHKQNKSCEKCNPNGQDLKLKKGDRKANTKAGSSSDQKASR
jgi:hypothetical protein